MEIASCMFEAKKQKKEKRYYFQRILDCVQIVLSVNALVKQMIGYVQSQRLHFHCTPMNLQTLEKCLEVNCWSFKEVPKEIIKVFKAVNESFETKKIL